MGEILTIPYDRTNCDEQHAIVTLESKVFLKETSLAGDSGLEDAMTIIEYNTQAPSDCIPSISQS